MGTLEETITVTGESSVVDVSSAQRQQVINSEVMASIPASRSYEGLAALVPGIQLATSSQNVRGTQGPVPPYFTGHGGSSFEGRLTNSSVTLTYNNEYGTTWLRPTTFMPARWVKITGQLNF